MHDDADVMYSFTFMMLMIKHLTLRQLSIHGELCERKIVDLIRRHKALRHTHARNTLDKVLPHTLEEMMMMMMAMTMMMVMMIMMIYIL